MSFLLVANTLTVLVIALVLYGVMSLLGLPSIVTDIVVGMFLIRGIL